MVFTSITFLFVFLPVSLATYFVAPRRFRNAVLFVTSILFYTWGSGALVGILFVSIAVDYRLGFLAERTARTGDQRGQRRVIALSATTNLCLLGWFKYAGFLAEQLNTIGEATGVGTIAWDGVTLPIGISFFTFQSMSYTIDVVRGRCKHLTNPVDFALYVALFPQLIAGPIVRFHEISPQLIERRTGMSEFAEGAVRFSHGLFKKVVIADTVAPVADAAFALQTAELSPTTAWIGITAYSLQIYFDFSGYSDMAIGLGKMFGFTFPENFRRPYSATSVTDFWRRWHITLSNWFRDYLYIPLGGNRGTRTRVGANLLLVFFVTGLWHGANWTFVVWGLYHGAWLLLERVSGLRDRKPFGLMIIVRRITTLIIVMIGWVFFRSPDVGTAVEYLGAMMGAGGGIHSSLDLVLIDRTVIVLLLASLVCLLPPIFVTGPFLVGATDRRAVLARFATLGVGLPIALFLVAAGGFSPFLYFQF